MKKLDFNSIQRPTLELTMRDDARTVLHVTVPSEQLIRELLTFAEEMKEVLEKKDGRAIEAAFELMAKLMSCNEEYKTVTAQDLRNVYRFSLSDMIIFTQAYLEFINEINNAKN